MTNKESIQEIQFNHVRWINISKPSKANLAYVKKQFPLFLDLDIQTCLPPLQNPRIHTRPDYLFLVLTFPVLEKKQNRIIPVEIDFFITKDTIITVHDNTIPPVRNLFTDLLKNTDQERKKRYNECSLERFLFKILSKCYLYCFPILNEFNSDSFEIEKHIFASNTTHAQDAQLIREILMIKRNIGNFRKALHSHKNVLKRFMSHASGFFQNPKEIQQYFSILVEHTKDIWEVEETHRDVIHALYQTHESMISTRLNDIMKTLTVFSVIFLPLTLIASIFGMNISHLPLSNGELDFWLILGIMALIASTLVWLFKKLRWL